MDCHALARDGEADHLHLSWNIRPSTRRAASCARSVGMLRDAIGALLCGRRAISLPQPEARRLLLSGSMSSSSAWPPSA